MKNIYLVCGITDSIRDTEEALMAFDDVQDALNMAEINNWSVREILLIEKDKGKINFRTVD